MDKRWQAGDGDNLFPVVHVIPDDSSPLKLLALHVTIENHLVGSLAKKRPKNIVKTRILNSPLPCIGGRVRCLGWQYGATTNV